MAVPGLNLPGLSGSRLWRTDQHAIAGRGTYLLGAFVFSFSFSEDDYKKTFIISKIDTDNSSVYNITGNYHYDKFKDTKSTSRTKDYVKEQINTNFEKFLKEFDNLSDGVIKLWTT